MLAGDGIFFGGNKQHHLFGMCHFDAHKVNDGAQEDPFDTLCLPLYNFIFYARFILSLIFICLT